MIFGAIHDKCINTAKPPSSTFVVVKRLLQPKLFIDLEAVTLGKKWSGTIQTASLLRWNRRTRVGTPSRWLVWATIGQAVEHRKERCHFQLSRLVGKPGKFFVSLRTLSRCFSLPGNLWHITSVGCGPAPAA